MYATHATHTAPSSLSFSVATIIPFVLVARVRECRIKCSKHKCCAKCCPKDPPRCELAAVRILHMDVHMDGEDNTDIEVREQVVDGANPMVEIEMSKFKKRQMSRLAKRAASKSMVPTPRPTQIDIDIRHDSHGEASASDQESGNY